MFAGVVMFPISIELDDIYPLGRMFGVARGEYMVHRRIRPNSPINEYELWKDGHRSCICRTAQGVYGLWMDVHRSCIVPWIGCPLNSVS